MCQDGVCRAATCPRQPQHSLPWAPERAAYLGHKSREKRAPDADRLSSTVLTLLTGSGQCSTIFETKTVLQEMPKAMDSQAAGDAAVPGLKMARRPMHTRSCDRPEVPWDIRSWWQPRLRLSCQGNTNVQNTRAPNVFGERSEHRPSWSGVQLFTAVSAARRCERTQTT